MGHRSQGCRGEFLPRGADEPVRGAALSVGSRPPPPPNSALTWSSGHHTVSWPCSGPGPTTSWLRSGGCRLCLSDSAVAVSSPDHSSWPVSGVRDQGPLSFPPLQTVWSGQVTPEVCLLVRRMGLTSVALVRSTGDDVRKALGTVPGML